MFSLFKYLPLALLVSGTTLGATPKCFAPPQTPIDTTLINDILDSPNLTSALPQELTNGVGSFLGTLSAPRLPRFLGDASIASLPWGNATVSNRNPEDPPTTGVTRYYNFTISRGVLNPDGVNRSMLLINGQFPGPVLEANWGDWISVTVNNNISTAVEGGAPVEHEGTSLHWHGLLQKGTPFMDGIPSVQQCPIAPGTTFTYTFRADSYGTSWYHSHMFAQYSAGAFGPMIIYGPSSAPYDVDLGPVMLSDWYHDDYYTLVQQVSGTNRTTVSANNTLINGKMNYDCSLLQNETVTFSPHTCTPNSGLSKFQFETGKTHRLRLVNSGAEGQIRFSIDHHNLTVIANDFVPIKPYSTTYVTLGVGQRMEILVNATAATGSAFWMRASVPDTSLASHCSQGFQPVALAAIYYTGVDTDSAPRTTPYLIEDVADCGIDDSQLASSAYHSSPPAPQATQVSTVSSKFNDSCSKLFYMDDSSFVGDYNSPILPLAAAGNVSYPRTWNVYDFGSDNSVFVYLNNTSTTAHPMHLHGHNFWVLAQGQGEWDGNVHGADTENPVRRDTQILPKAKTDAAGNLLGPGFLVLLYELNNPGVWPLHCHIAWHVGSGFYANMVEQPKKLAGLNVPNIVQETCSNWQAYTNAGGVVDQIDSGL